MEFPSALFVYREQPMSKVLCKFHLYSIERIPWYGEQKEATKFKFAPDQGEPFGKATPQGNIEMVVVNPAAAEQLTKHQINTSFYVTFEPVE